MDDLINRKAAIEALEFERDTNETPERIKGVEDAIEAIQYLSSIPAVLLDKLCALLGENADCPPEHDRCKGNCAECWKSVLEEWMKEYDQGFL